MQSESAVNSFPVLKLGTRTILTSAAAVATAAVTLYLAGIDAPDHPSEQKPRRSVLVETETAPPEEAQTAPEPLPEREGGVQPEGRANRRVDPADARALEAQWHAASTTQSRREIAENLAAENDADAVRVIGRLMLIERHPELRRALLSGLAEIDPSVAVEERLGIVRSALSSSSPQIRVIALAALDALDDPRVIPLLTRLSEEDADSTVRIVATRMMRARAETDAALSGEQDE